MCYIYGMETVTISRPKYQALQDEVCLLREQNRLLKAKIFGRKSEKIEVTNEVQDSLFHDMQPDSENDPIADKEIQVEKHTRKKGGRKKLPDHLEQEIIVHRLEGKDRRCECGCEMSEIGFDESRQLDIIPAKAIVVCHRRMKYACKSCEGIETEGGTVRIAPVPNQIIPKSIATPGLLAYLLTHKYVDALPYYRQEKRFRRIGVALSRSNMCSWTVQVAQKCKEVMEILQDHIKSGDIIRIDETTHQVMKEKGRKNKTKSYMWVIRGGPPDRVAIMYHYHPTRASHVAQELLEGFEGYVQTDGYVGYDFIDRSEKMHHVGCFAHARRKFMDVIKSQGKTKTPGHAQYAIKTLAELYKIEKEAKEQGIKGPDLLALRQEKSKPLLDKFHEWLLEKRVMTPPKSALGVAINYSLKMWNRLIRYLDHSQLTPDNNWVENAIRPFVVGRKNWLLSGHPNGANASAVMYSLVESAKANGWEPYAYLRHLLEGIQNGSKSTDLLPFNPPQMERG